MATATRTFFHDYTNRLARGVHDLATDELKIALSNTAPTAATDTVFADITEITAGNGYTAGGFVLANRSFTSVAGLVTVDGDDIQIDASGGNIGGFRYPILYNNTPTSPADPLICFYDIGEEVTILDGASYQLRLNASGLLTVALQA